MVDRITPTQVDIMRALLKLNRGVPREELLSLMPRKILLQNIGTAIKPLAGYFIKVEKDLSKKGPGSKPDIISLTAAAKDEIKAFNKANSY